MMEAFSLSVSHQRPDRVQLAAALEAADMLVHGSGPSLVAADDLRVWAATGRPYGFFGVSVDPLSPMFTGTLDEIETMVRALGRGGIDEHQLAVLDGAAFVYCRDSITEVFLRSLGLTGPAVAFGPDATIAFDVLDEEAAAMTKARYGLVEGEYLCAVPRLRWTPYFQIRGEAPSPLDFRRTAYNELWAGHDFGVLAAAMVAYVRRTGHPVLVAPEMSYAVELAGRHFGDALPADVRPYVRVLDRFWSAPEAMTVYRDAQAVVSLECHSPLMALSQGTPAVYVRQPTDTLKGRMYADLGVPHRSTEIGDGPVPVVTALQRILDDPAAARAETAAIRDRAHERLRGMAEHVLACAAPLTRRTAPPLGT